MDKLLSSNTLLRPKVLALGPQNVFPPTDGGKEGIYGALAALACFCDVTYAYPCTDSRSIEDYRDIGVTAAPYNYEPSETYLNIVLATISAKPYKFEKYCSHAAVDALCSSVLAKDFTVIVCHHAHTFGLARKYARRVGLNVPIVVREHNIEYELVESYRDSVRGLSRIAASFYAWLTRHEEMRIWKSASAVGFLSDQDLRTAQKAMGAQISNFFLAREGVPIPAMRDAHFPREDAPLLVLLNPQATQSVANLKTFVHKYWYPLRKRHLIDNFELHITGVSQEQLSELMELKGESLINLGIHATGFLPSITSALESALALVSPTFVGGGIRKKVLEAMAHQLPVIATKLDIESCDYFTSGENIFLLRSPDSFADFLKELRANEHNWLYISKQARTTVEEFANWDIYGQAMYQMICNLQLKHYCWR